MLNLIGRYRIEVETFGDRLQKALDQINRERQDAGRDEVKKAHLAKACGVAPAAVSQWVSGETKNMKLENLFAAADFLGIEPRWLATGEGPMRVNRQNLVDLSHLDPKQRAAFQALVRPNGDKSTGGNHGH